MTWHVLVYIYVIIGLVNAGLMDHVGRKIGMRKKIGELAYTISILLSFFLWPAVFIVGILSKKEP